MIGSMKDVVGAQIPSHQLKEPLSQLEVEGLATALNEWVGAQLQSVEVEADAPARAKGAVYPRTLRLGFYLQGQTKWALVDYHKLAPALIVFPDGRSPRPLKKKMRRPLELFLRSHFVGRRLRAVGVHMDFGRVVDLFFDPDESGGIRKLEINLAPHERNVLAEAGEKSLSEFKPTDGVSFSRPLSPISRSRTVIEIFNEWWGSDPIDGTRNDRLETGASRGAKPMRASEYEIEKKKKALEKVRAEIEAKVQSPARHVGEWIKANQTLDVPSEWRALIKKSETLPEAVERLFREAKLNERKIDGTRARAAQLEKEIVDLESGHFQERVRDRLLESAEAKGRKFDIASDLTLYLGKSAKENISILRKAQPFDLWLHLRERPGAHGILRRPRGRVVSDQELLLAGVKVAEQSLKKRATEMRGEAFDLLVAECRFVRPVKSQPGLVNYSNERTLRLKI